MKIERILAWRVELPLHEGSYAWSGGKSVEVFDSTIVRVETASGQAGHGEVCPLGPVYLPAYAAGARTGIAAIAPALIGQDPRRLDRIQQRMDSALKGHPYAKSALDVACWDLLGQDCGLPLSELLGGACGEDFLLYRAISQDEPAAMAERVAHFRQQGYRRFQLKVGGDPAQDVARVRAVRERMQPDEVLIADANTGWLAHDAIRVVRAMEELDVYVEQPCATYEECLSVRRRTRHPFVLDESIDSLEALLRALADDAMDAVNLKISKLGGLTRARQLRDLCCARGIAVTIEDSWGSDVATAAIAHLAHSTPTELLFTSTDFNDYVTVSTATGAPQRAGGRMRASREPGLGITLRPEVLGEPVFDSARP